MPESLDIKKLILVPSVITLLLSVIRLVGELIGGPELLFGREAGGGGALLGIVWLVPVFGVYFAIKVNCAGHTPRSAGKLIGLSILGFVVIMGVFMGALSILGQGSWLALIICSFAALGICLVVRSSWPELFQVLFTYGFAARIPVMVIMFFAIMLDLGTHYDAPPPEMEAIGSWFMEWVITGLIPQGTIWIAFTVLVGSLFGGVTSLFLKKS